MTDPVEAPTLSSFAPIEGERVAVLVLGSMPGVASLDAGAYYAHPRNAFWPILMAWLNARAPDRAATLKIPYASRADRLRHAGIGVWDVLAHCHRPGSLDSAIVRASEVPNDIPALVARHPELRRIVFNGRAAEQLFTRHIDLTDSRPGREPPPERFSAPSTSPAMASLNLSAKHAAWCDALGPPPEATGAASAHG